MSSSQHINTSTHQHSNTPNQDTNSINTTITSPLSPLQIFNEVEQILPVAFLLRLAILILLCCFLFLVKSGEQALPPSQPNKWSAKTLIPDHQHIDTPLNRDSATNQRLTEHIIYQHGCITAR
jgi:hypothetical protein